ncbi:MAG: hypothetical protein Q9162_005326 [Coniocarpon cinnabarinum]
MATTQITGNAMRREDGKSKRLSDRGKPAPGMENLYGKNSALNSNNAVKSQSSDAETESILSEQDEKDLNELAELIQRGMPKSQQHDFQAAVKALRKEGIPNDLRDVLDTWRGKKSLDLITAAKVVRITTGLARKAAQNHFDEREKKEADSQSEKQKSGAHDPGPSSRRNREKSGGDQKSSGNFGNFKVGGYTLDAGTILTSAFVSFMLYRSLFPGENSRDITWQEFRTQFFDRGLVQKLTVVNRNRVKVILNQDAVRSYYPDSPAAHGGFFFYFSIGDVATFERHLDEAHNELAIPSSQRIPVSYVEETPVAGILLSWIPTLLLIGSTFWLFRRQSGGSGSGGGLFGMGRSRAKRFNHETDIKVSFKDVAGMDEAKQEITEFVSFLKEPEQYQKLGAKIPRGAILSGPPGTGKTLLAKATAGESQVPFFSVSGSEFVEMFVGVGASRVRDLFANARKNAPCIIFIDEIDAIGKSRGKNVTSGGNDEREATLNQILTEMDGFSTSEQVVVLAGTNRQDVLDNALIRPGRFDRNIQIDRPTMEGRKQIFAVHLKKIVTKEDAEYLQGRLAALTPGFSGADIANCVNEAALIAARYKAADVTMQHFEAAIERVIGGLEKKSLVLNPEEKKTVAYHEAGHAICGWFFKYADPLLKVSIIPRGQGALGYAQYLPAGDTYLMNVNQLMDRMSMTLGGRVSEELHFTTVTSGASDDFNKVTRMATMMVTKWGMSDKIGHLFYDDDAQQQLHKPFSEETAKNIDHEVKRIVGEAYKQCRDLLSEKKKEIGLVAEELLSKEVLSRDDMIRLLGKRPFEDSSQDFTKYFGSRGDREGAPDPKPGEAEPESGAGGPMPGGIGPAPTAFRDLK